MRLKGILLILTLILTLLLSTTLMKHTVRCEAVGLAQVIIEVMGERNLVLPKATVLVFYKDKLVERKVCDDNGKCVMILVGGKKYKLVVNFKGIEKVKEIYVSPWNTTIIKVKLPVYLVVFGRPITFSMFITLIVLSLLILIGIIILIYEITLWRRKKVAMALKPVKVGIRG